MRKPVQAPPPSPKGFEARIRPMNQHELERLLVAEAVKRLVLDSIHCVDNRRYAELAALFTEDGELFRPTADAPLVGPKAIMDAYSLTPPGRLSRHLITNQRVDVLGKGEIEVHSYALIYASEDGESPGRHGALASRCLVGEFQDLCVQVNDEWRIRRRRARFVLQANPTT